MRKSLVLIGAAVTTALAYIPAAQANDANTVFNGISAATGVIGVFQRSKTNSHLNAIEQNQEQRNYHDYSREQAQDSAAARRAAANRRASAEKAAADKRAAEQARQEAAQTKASENAARQRELDALKYN